jgi:hypothetical protein
MPRVEYSERKYVVGASVKLLFVLVEVAEKYENLVCSFIFISYSKEAFEIKCNW